MATLSGKLQIITFKAEDALVEAMDDIPNRSEFIRSAILAALDGVCPLCHGTGVSESPPAAALAGVQPNALRRTVRRVRRRQTRVPVCARVMGRLVATVRVARLAVALLLAVAVSFRTATAADLPVVFVSIPPQKFVVEHLAGDLARVEVMLPPGASPATYEPTPRQMAALNGAVLYLQIGVPFEGPVLAKISTLAPDLEVVDCRQGVTLVPMEDSDDGHGHGPLDPHIWLDPVRMKTVARTTARALSEKVPAAAAGIESLLSRPPRGDRRDRPPDRSPTGALRGTRSARLPPRLRLFRPPLRAGPDRRRGRGQVPIGASAGGDRGQSGRSRNPGHFCPTTVFADRCAPGCRCTRLSGGGFGPPRRRVPRQP